MSNMMIGYRNRIDGATLSGGNWSTSLPLTNLQERQLGIVARSATDSTTDAQFTADLGASYSLQVIGITAFNLSIDAQVRFSLADSSGFSPEDYNSGWLDVWPSHMAAEDIGDARWTKAVALPAAVDSRYLKVEIDDTTNADGYIEIGRVFVGAGWQPATNMSYGASIGREDLSQVQTALSGSEYFYRRRAPRVFRASTEWLTEAEAMTGAAKLQRVAGVTGEVLAIWDTADTYDMERSFLGRFRELSPIEHPYFATNSVGWEVKEL